MDLPQRQGRAGQARSASAGKTFVDEQRSDRYRDSTSLGQSGIGKEAQLCITSPVSATGGTGATSDRPLLHTWHRGLPPAGRTPPPGWRPGHWTESLVLQRGRRLFVPRIGLFGTTMDSCKSVQDNFSW